jgi:hypothetical protein
VRLSRKYQLSEQPNAGNEKAGPPKGPGRPRRYRLLARMAGPAILTIIGILLTYFTANALVSYTFTNARYVSQETVRSNNKPPELCVQVIFSAGNHAKKACINPNPKNGDLPWFLSVSSTTLLSTRTPVPIFYTNSNPSRAFYAGSNGSSQFTYVIYFLVFASILLLLGMMFLVFRIVWWLRIIALVGQPENRHAVWLDWQRFPEVATAYQEGGPIYTWVVLPPDTSVAAIRRFFRCFRSPAQERTWPRWKLTRTLRNVWNCAKAGAPRRPAGWWAMVLGDLGPHQWIVIPTGGEPVVPTSRAEPVIGTGPAVQPQPIGDATLLLAHRRLLAAYAGILDQARQLPIFVCPQTEDDKRPSAYRTLLCWRLLVRLHIESHVRRQLKQLGNSYIRAQMLITGTSGDADDKRRCLDQLRQDCQLLTSSLADTRRRAVAVLLGVATVLPFILVTAKIPQIPLSLWAKFSLIFILVAILLPGLFALRGYNDAFRCKRRLLSSSTLIEALTANSRKDVYQLEDAVFDLIKQRNRPERASDCWAYEVVLAALITAMIAESQTIPVSLLTYIEILWAAWLIVLIYRRLRPIGSRIKRSRARAMTGRF